MEFIILMVCLVIIVSIGIKLGSDFKPKKSTFDKTSILANVQKPIDRFPAESSETSSDFGQKSEASDGYTLIASSIGASVTTLLTPFRQAATIIGHSPNSFNEIQFFAGFLRYADSFTEEVCFSLAKGIRQMSSVTEVRGTPTTTLAKRIRSESFEKLDAVLNQYAQVLNLLGVEYSRRSVSGSAITGAVVGKVLSGGGEGSNEFAVLGGLVGAVGEMSSKAVIRTQARLAAYVAIQRYLDTLLTLPEPLLDMGVALIYGGTVDFNRQSAALTTIQESVAKKVRISGDLVRLMPQVNTPDKNPAQDLPPNEFVGYIVGGALLLIGVIATVLELRELTQTVRKEYDLNKMLAGVGSLLAALGLLAFTIKTTIMRNKVGGRGPKPENVSSRIQRLRDSL